MMALGSFSSGQLLAHYGWSMVNMVVFPPVLLGLAVLSLASFAKRRAKLRRSTKFPIRVSDLQFVCWRPHADTRPSR
jgi:hypothetical protein